MVLFQDGNMRAKTGNVSSWTWRQYGQPERAYGFTYDGIGRLTDTYLFEGPDPVDDFREFVQYDRNGNITRLQQDNGGTTSVRTWTYTGNHRNAYTYDDNGNIYCRNEAVDDEDCIHMSYNILNLPEQALWYDDDHIDYEYLADGTKCSALNYDGEGFRYAGPFRFQALYEEDDILESVTVAGGRIVRKEHPSAPVTYEPRYFITDHLGSTRVVVDSLGTILQQVDYLPYGEKCRNNALVSGNNDYLYGGKEFQATFFNIPWYDSQARYQTTDGIFVSLDPQCEKYYSISPYAYCAGNPVNRVDIDGRVITDYFDSSGEFLYTDKIDNGKIKISSPEIIEMAEVLSTPSEVNSFIADNSVSFHKAYELNIIDQESALKVYEYYNNTGLPLFIDNTISGNFEFNNQGNNHSLRISVNIDKNLTPNKQGFTLDNYFDINNSLNAHEGRGHYNM